MANLLSQKAMLASLAISQWSARRLDRKITDEVNEEHNAAKDAGRYNKLLIEKAALEPIQKIVSEARLYHLSRTQPWLDSGSRILPAALYFDYSTHLHKLEVDFERAADVFATNFPRYVAERRDALNGLFNVSDYPHPDKVRGLFSFETVILPCPDASDFRVDLATEHADDIRVSIEKRTKQALNDAVQEPVKRVVDLVGRMAERLHTYKPSEGKGDRATGVFRDSLVGNVRELADLLPAFNLIGDPAIDHITSRIKTELCQNDAETLRESDAVRATVAASAEDILAKARQYLA